MPQYTPKLDFLCFGGESFSGTESIAVKNDGLSVSYRMNFWLLYVEDAEEGGCGGGGRKEYFVPVIANGVTVEDKKWGMGKLWMKFGAAAQFPDGKWARERVVAREW